MPELCRFAGIVVYLPLKDTKHHDKPHVHVRYGEYEASVAVDGELLAGSLPRRQMTIAVGWLALREEEVYVAWNEAVQGRCFDEIEGYPGGSTYEADGICHAGTPTNQARIVEATPLVKGMLQVLFASGEKRLFDTTRISGSAFAPLRDGTAQPTVRVKHGFVSWLDGKIDLAPEYVYEHSLVYDDAPEDLPVG